jgi:hypothetical protein
MCLVKNYYCFVKFADRFYIKCGNLSQLTDSGLWCQSQLTLVILSSFEIISQCDKIFTKIASSPDIFAITFGFMTFYIHIYLRVAEPFTDRET